MTQEEFIEDAASKYLKGDQMTAICQAEHPKVILFEREFIHHFPTATPSQIWRAVEQGLGVKL